MKSLNEVSQFKKDFELGEKEFADLVGVTYQAVRLWDRDQRRIPLMLLRLMRLFRKYPQLMKDFK